jgi:hypothetical protein
MIKYLIFIFSALCLIQCNGDESNHRGHKENELYLQRKFGARVKTIDSLLAKKNVEYNKNTTNESVHWEIGNKRNIELYLRHGVFSEEIVFGDWEYKDTVYCYEGCWDTREDYEIWTKRQNLELRYDFVEREIESDNNERDRFMKSITDSIFSTKPSLSKEEWARWQQFKSTERYNDLDAFLELWNPNLKRLDKVEEWDAWYEKTHKR